ncbi:MAG TPA: sigma-70 family RNA polymerase sigma factor [Gemmatimonadaceae bacterium]|jgi:RNA polymerase sigma-70 factor (ECF subfamily)
MERAEVTAGIRRRDPAVLDAVLREALPRLLIAARAAGLTGDAAEDVAHAAVLVFLERAAAFDGRARATTWLLGILANKIAERRRADQREEATDAIDAVFDARFDDHGTWRTPPRGPLEALAGEELQRVLRDCLDGIPDRQRQALLLREADEVSTDETCKILGVSANNLGVLLFRARVRMRECLEAKGVRGSADARV